MTSAVHLGGPEDLDQVLSLMARGHAERGLFHDDDHRRKAVTPLLSGSPHGAVWLIGPRRAPLGYVLVSFGWSVDLAAMEGWLVDIFVRPSVRRRGIGTEVMHGIAVSLAQGGVRALHVRLDRADTITAAFCARTGFVPQPDQMVMSDNL